VSDRLYTKPTAPDEVFLTPQELARRWKMNPVSLAGQRARGTGPKFIRINGRVRYPFSAIAEFEAGTA
jgi:hypothetical protein